MNTWLKVGIGVAVIALFAVGLWFGGLLRVGPAQAPSLGREISFPADFPQEARTILTQNVETLRAQLRQDPEDVSAWLDLAIQYKTINDFDGAVEIWEYLAGAKKHPVAYYNLGSTYHLDLKQYARSEDYFRKAVEANPGFALNYMGLHELYKYSYKQDSTLAADSLKEGIDKVTHNSRIDLITALAGYYVEKGDKTQAVEWYSKAKLAATSAGNPALANQIQKQIALINS